MHDHPTTCHGPNYANGNFENAFYIYEKALGKDDPHTVLLLTQNSFSLTNPGLGDLEKGKE